ncbi:MAG: phosphatase PAP2 family protein [Bryobacteraceae bacterium]
MQPIGVNINVNFLVCLVLFLASRPALRVMIAAAVVGASLCLFLGLHGGVLHGALEVLSYCGAGALPAVWLMPFLCGRSDLTLLVKLLFPPCFGLLTSLILNTGSHGFTYDHFLYRFDGSLGFQPSFLAGTLTATPWVYQVTRSLYEALPLFLVTAYLIQDRRGPGYGRRFFILIVLVGLCGAACFFLFPAVGAYWLFAKSFPFHPPASSAIPLIPTVVSAAVPRNCMPSLHTSWALLVFWATSGCRLRWRLPLWTLMGFMLLQTLVYHYLIDMVVAFPFTLAMYLLIRTTVPWSSIAWRSAFGFGLAVTACWLVLLRWGIGIFQVSPFVPWSAMAFTIAGSIWLWTFAGKEMAQQPRTADPLDWGAVIPTGASTAAGK